MLKLREMLQWEGDLEFVCLQGLMAFMLCEALHEEMCGEGERQFLTTFHDNTPR